MTPQFVLELQHKVAELRNQETKHLNTAANYEKAADQERETAVFYATSADQWQKVLDFAVLADSNDDLAHAFANAVLDRDAEMEAALDAEGAETVMSSKERYENDRDDEFRIDAEDDARWGDAAQNGAF